jgi:hypothetical protein
MFEYHYRASNQYNRPICSLAIPADDRPRWLPKAFGYDVDGFRLRFETRTVGEPDFHRFFLGLQAGFDENRF